MSGNLEVNADGTFNAAYAGDAPWWETGKLGKKVPADISSAEICKVANVDWEVEKRPLFFEEDQNGIMKKAHGKQALVRVSDNKLLDFVGQDWEPLQNEEAFEFFDEFVRVGKMTMESAGCIDRNGKLNVWALANINKPFEIFKGDVIQPYLLFSNPHIYGRTIDISETDVRVVCDNTLTWALSKMAKQLKNADASVRSVRVGHRRKFDPEMVKDALLMVSERNETFREAAKFLGSKMYKNETLLGYLDRVFPASTKKNADPKKNKSYSRNAKIAADIVNTQPGAEFGRGSWWQAFNSVTYMTDHIVGHNAMNRADSAWFGSKKSMKQKAFEIALECAEAA